jgi:hypothetical protein
MKGMGSPSGSLKISSGPTEVFVTGIFETQGGRRVFLTQPEKKTPKTKIRSIHGENFFIN